MSIFLLSKPTAHSSLAVPSKKPNRQDKGKAVIQSSLQSDIVETSRAREPERKNARGDKKQGLAAKLFSNLCFRPPAEPPLENDSDIFARIRKGAMHEGSSQAEQKGKLQVEDSIPNDASSVDPQALAAFLRERRQDMEAADKDIALLRLKRLPLDAMTCKETYTPLPDDKNTDALFFREIREKQGAFKKKHPVLKALKALSPWKREEKTFNQIIKEGQKLPPVTTEEVIFNLPPNQSAEMRSFLWDPDNWISEYKYYPNENSVDARWGKIRQEDNIDLEMPSLPEGDDWAPQPR